MTAPYPTPKNTPYTAEQVKKFFRDRGITLTEWAKSNGYPRHLVYSLISGANKATYGKSHEIAVRLGLKLSP
ncbi:DNA-binding protein [Alphaproteobacteria bacterium]|nr:DNA-binding protein [Alphaproteobacteria bacterium]